MSSHIQSAFEILTQAKPTEAELKIFAEIESQIEDERTADLADVVMQTGLSKEEVVRVTRRLVDLRIINATTDLFEGSRLPPAISGSLRTGILSVADYQIEDLREMGIEQDKIDNLVAVSTLYEGVLYYPDDITEEDVRASLKKNEKEDDQEEFVKAEEDDQEEFIKPEEDDQESSVYRDNGGDDEPEKSEEMEKKPAMAQSSETEIQQDLQRSMDELPEASEKDANDLEEDSSSEDIPHDPIPPVAEDEDKNVIPMGSDREDLLTKPSTESGDEGGLDEIRISSADRSSADQSSVAEAASFPGLAARLKTSKSTLKSIAIAAAALFMVGGVTKVYSDIFDTKVLVSDSSKENVLIQRDRFQKITAEVVMLKEKIIAMEAATAAKEDKAASEAILRTEAIWKSKAKESYQQGYNEGILVSKSQSKMSESTRLRHAVVNGECQALGRGNRIDKVFPTNLPLEVISWQVDPQNLTIVGVVGQNVDLLRLQESPITQVVCHAGKADIWPSHEKPKLGQDGMSRPVAKSGEAIETNPMLSNR